MLDITECYETLFKDKSKVADMFRISFEELLKIKLSPIFCRMSSAYLQVI